MKIKPNINKIVIGILIILFALIFTFANTILVISLLWTIVSVFLIYLVLSKKYYIKTKILLISLIVSSYLWLGNICYDLVRSHNILSKTPDNYKWLITFSYTVGAIGLTVLIISAILVFVKRVKEV